MEELEIFYDWELMCHEVHYSYKGETIVKARIGKVQKLSFFTGFTDCNYFELVCCLVLTMQEELKEYKRFKATKAAQLN